MGAQRSPGEPTGSAGREGAAGHGGTGEPDVDRFAVLISAGVAGQAEGPVDVEGLLDEARVGAVRIRRRRRVVGGVAVAVVVVVALPVLAVGTGLLEGRGLFGNRPVLTQARTGSTTDPADPAVPADPADPADSGESGGSGTSAATPYPTGGVFSLPGPGQSLPGGTQVSGPTEAVLSQDAAGRYVVGETAILQAPDVGDAGVAPVRRTDARATPDGAGPTRAPVCRTLPAASARTAGGRSVGYAGAGDDAWTVRTVVRVLRGRAAEDEFGWLQKSMGYCLSELRLRRAPVKGLPGDGVVLGYQVGAPSQRPSSVLVVGVVRQGRTTSSVEVVVPESAAVDTQARVQLGLNETGRLLALADQRLRVSGLVAQAQADPQLAS